MTSDNYNKENSHLLDLKNFNRVLLIHHMLAMGEVVLLSVVFRVIKENLPDKDKVLCLRCDVTKYQQLDRLFEEHQFDFVYQWQLLGHLVSYTTDLLYMLCNISLYMIYGLSGSINCVCSPK